MEKLCTHTGWASVSLVADLIVIVAAAAAAAVLVCCFSFFLSISFTYILQLFTHKLCKNFKAKEGKRERNTFKDVVLFVFGLLLIISNEE